MIIPLWPLSIKVDVLLVQIVNVLILFFMFKKLFGQTLVDEIKKRKSLTKKLQSAEIEYETLLAKAHQEKDAIIAEALTHKQNVLQEALSLAEEARKQAIAKADAQASEIIEKAQRETTAAKEELLAHYEAWVKKTTMQVVEKIFHDDKKLQETYVDMLVKETIATSWSVIR